MKSFLLLISALFLITIQADAQKGQSESKAAAQIETAAMHKVIMQLTSNDTLAHKALMNQLKNLRDVWGDSAVIEVLIQGPGLDLLLQSKSTQPDNIAKLRKEGIHFVVCEHSMKQRKIVKEDLLPDLEFVKYGLVEIITRQEKGWSYLKAGF